jgi:hypothetical protein
MNWIRDYERITIEVHVDSLYHIKMLQPSYLKSRNEVKSKDLILWGVARVCDCDITLDCGNFHLKTAYNTLGNFTISGSSNSGFIWIYFGTNVYAGGLQTNRTKVLSYTTGDIYVNALDKLEVDMYSGGDVYYSGNPAEIILGEQKMGSRLIEVQ